MTWKNEKERHSMAKRGIKTKEHKLIANGKKNNLKLKEPVKFVGDQEIDNFPENFEFSGDPEEIKKLWGEEWTHIVDDVTQRASELEEYGDEEDSEDYNSDFGYVEIWKGKLIGKTRTWAIEACMYERTNSGGQEDIYFNVKEIKHTKAN